MIAAGSAYLRIVGPCFGFFGFGMALYFASQGAGTLKWPVLAGFSRMVIAVGGGYLLLHFSRGLTAVFAALASGLAVFGLMISFAIWRGTWFRRK
jgi:Na+-driven multidrug efflux pump